jgi:replication-associated recombination protein RarA
MPSLLNITNQSPSLSEYSRPSQPLFELLRPQHVNELLLPQEIIDRLRRMIDAGAIMNMVFHGKPGRGKTSAARVISKEIDADTIEVSASTGSKDMIGRIEGFTSSASFKRKLKICFLDEADLISKSDQAAISHIVESRSGHCRFLLAMNDISKLTQPLQSRLLPVCFEIDPVGQAEIRNRLINAYEKKLPELGIEYDKQKLTKFVERYYPDLRVIANQIEFAFT